MSQDGVIGSLPTDGDPQRFTPYDEFRYPGKFYPQASPERMAALATLFGLVPPPVEHCRVLELGCGEGGHLVPLAYVLPQSRFLGVDLSQASIARARALAERVGSSNVEFRTADVAELADQAERFDYIIAHGLYSWVSEESQQAILDICGRQLAPQGVAYLSYNTYPGGHLRQIARDLSLFHTRAISDPSVKVREARNFAEFIVAAMPEGSLEREVMRKVTAQYARSEALTRFDLLAEINEPVYFLDFMERAASSGLQYIAESDVEFMRSAQLPEAARTWLDGITDRLLREQYLDFVHFRGFRKTLLCRAGHELDLVVTPQRMERLMVASSLRPTHTLADLHSGSPVEFRTATGRAVTCTEAVPKAVYSELGSAFPRALRYTELRARVCRRLNCTEPLDENVEAKMIQMLVSSFANGVAELHVFQPAFRTEISERPVASTIARIQAAANEPVSSMYLASFMLENPVLRGLLVLLDGSRDRQALLDDLRIRIPAEDARPVHAAEVEDSLKTLAEYGLLVG